MAPAYDGEFGPAKEGAIYLPAPLPEPRTAQQPSGTVLRYPPLPRDLDQIESLTIDEIANKLSEGSASTQHSQFLWTLLNELSPHLQAELNKTDGGMFERMFRTELAELLDMRATYIRPLLGAKLFAFDDTPILLVFTTK